MRTIFMAFALVAVALHRPAAGQAPQGPADIIRRWPIAEGGNDHWYELRIDAQPMSWSQAEHLALSRGGHLATLTTREELQFVITLARSTPKAWASYPGSPNVGPWVGAYDDARAGASRAWHWVTGEPFDSALCQAPQERGDDWRLMLTQAGVVEKRGESRAPPSCIIEYGPAGKPAHYKPPTLVQWKRADGGNDHYYRLYVEPKGFQWDEASRIAQRAGGFLASLTTPEENAFVLNFAKPLDVAWKQWGGVTLGPWIGGIKNAGIEAPDQGWRWWTGEPFEQTFWAPGNAPEAGNDAEGRGKRLLLFPLGWDDVSGEMDQVTSCIIEYYHKPADPPQSSPPPRTQTGAQAAKHPAATAALAYIEAVKKSDAKVGVRFWTADGLLRLIFPAEFDKAPEGDRAIMRQRLTKYLARSFHPAAAEQARRSRVTILAATPQNADGSVVKLEFDARDEFGTRRNWFIMERVGSVWRLADQGREGSASMSEALRNDRELLALGPMEFLEEISADDEPKPPRR